MNKQFFREPDKLHLVWIFPARLDTYLSAATWLQPTRELREMGWKVTLINFGKRGVENIGGIEVQNLPSPDIYFLRQFFFHFNTVGFILSNWKSIDLILINQSSASWILPLRFFRSFQQKKKPLFVMDTRTVPMEDNHTATIRDRLRGWFLLMNNRLGNSWADGQTAITQRMADCVNIPPNRLWGLWPSGVDVEKFAGTSGKRIWPRGDEPINLTYIGVLHYERNLMSLCKAAEMANKEGMNFVLSLTGSGTEQEDLEKFASQTEGRICVNPSVPSDQVPALLEKMHIGVLPFPDEEKYRVCSPVKLFEYMAAGLPILATRIVCFTDVITDNKFTFWAENATHEGLLSALRQIWNSRLSLKSMGIESEKAAQNCTWKESARKLSDALKFGLQRTSN